MYLITCEADDRRLAGRAVDTNVRNLTLPSVEMRLECFPTWEGMTGNRVLLHIADAVLRLALHARPIWRAGARTEAPMFCEGYKLVVELNRPAHRVVAHDKRAGIVHQHCPLSQLISKVILLPGALLLAWQNQGATSQVSSWMRRPCVASGWST